MRAESKGPTTSSIFEHLQEWKAQVCVYMYKNVRIRTREREEERGREGERETERENNVQVKSSQVKPVCPEAAP